MGGKGIQNAAGLYYGIVKYKPAAVLGSVLATCFDKGPAGWVLMAGPAFAGYIPEDVEGTPGRAGGGYPVEKIMHVMLAFDRIFG